MRSPDSEDVSPPRLIPVSEPYSVCTFHQDDYEEDVTRTYQVCGFSRSSWGVSAVLNLHREHARNMYKGDSVCARARIHTQ